MLASGDIRPFAATVEWSALARRVRTPSPSPYGYSERYYVAHVDLGQSAVAPTSGTAPAYLGRVVPYIRPTRDYYLSDLRARTHAPGTLATVVASSDTLAGPAVTVHDGAAPVLDTRDASPAVEVDQTWTLGAPALRCPALSLALTDIAAERRSVRGVPTGRAATIEVRDDGPLRLGVTGLRPVSGCGSPGPAWPRTASGGRP